MIIATVTDKLKKDEHYKAFPDSHLFAVHVKILSVDFDANNNDLVIPFAANRCVPQLSHVERRVNPSNNLQENVKHHISYTHKVCFCQIGEEE